MPELTICRTEHFNAAHRLHNPAWDEARNQQVFGKCNNPNYHGHNYNLVVRLTGPTDPETGYVFDLKALSTIIKREVLDRFDGEREIAYTTVMTVLDRLAKKDLVTRGRDGRAWRYTASSSRAELTSETLHHTLG